MKNKIKRKQIEETNKKLQEDMENSQIHELKKRLKDVEKELDIAQNFNSEYLNKINELNKKMPKLHFYALFKDWGFWGIIISVCGLFLAAGFNWGNNKFDSEKFQLKDQRDNYKHQLDSIKKDWVKKNNK